MSHQSINGLVAKWRNDARRYAGSEEAAVAESHARELEAALASPAPSAGVGVEAFGEVRIQDGCIVSTSIKRPLADGGYDVVPQRLTPPAAPSVSPAVEGGLDRASAEQEYTVTAFDYESAPVGSRDWTLFWNGWQAARRLATTEQPGSAVQGEVVAWKSPFGSCVCNSDNVCPGCNPNAAIELAREIATAEERRKHAPCMECGATSPEDAQGKCVCSGDKDDCHGCELWPEGATTPPPAPAAEQGIAEEAERNFFARDFYEEARTGRVPFPGQQPEARGVEGMVDRMIARYLELEPGEAVNGVTVDHPETRAFCRELLLAAAPAALGAAVDDAMVERACKAFYADESWRTNTNNSRDFIRTALTAAIDACIGGGEGK